MWEAYILGTTEKSPDGRSTPAGLCGGCAHVRGIRSARGSVFLLCDRSRDDARYPKYPRLPVLSCSGFTAP